jgi:hypothetical protein
LDKKNLGVTSHIFVNRKNKLGSHINVVLDHLIHSNENARGEATITLADHARGEATITLADLVSSDACPRGQTVYSSSTLTVSNEAKGNGGSVCRGHFGCKSL